MQAQPQQPTRRGAGRTDTWILVGYVVLVYGGLAGVAAFFWWAILNC